LKNKTLWFAQVEANSAVRLFQITFWLLQLTKWLSLAYYVDITPVVMLMFSIAKMLGPVSRPCPVVANAMAGF
jgi:predicted Co/Zn/Cd cation transporter (cation efflux family)